MLRYVTLLYVAYINTFACLYVCTTKWLDDEVYHISLERDLGVGIRFACVYIAKHRLQALIHELAGRRGQHRQGTTKRTKRHHQKNRCMPGDQQGKKALCGDDPWPQGPFEATFCDFDHISMCHLPRMTA